MPRRRGRDPQFNPTADINVTSLVDVAFTLLVIFLITAPIMQSGVDVNVPQAQSESITAPDGVVVTVTSDGSLYIGDAPVEDTQFDQALVDVVREKQARNLYLKADETVPYGKVLRVLGAMKALDVASVGLVAEPEGGG